MKTGFVRLALLGLSVWFLLLSCKRTTDNAVSLNQLDSLSPLNVRGQIYYYAPELDTTTYQAIGYCDCCSGNFIFLDDSIFLTVDHCESDATYTKGTYKVEQNKVLLKYDSVLVERNFNYDIEADTSGTILNKFSIVKGRIKEPKTVTLTRLHYTQNICFDTGIDEFSFATLDKTTKLNEFIDQLKVDSIYDKLGLR